MLNPATALDYGSKLSCLITIDRVVKICKCHILVVLVKVWLTGVIFWPPSPTGSTKSNSFLCATVRLVGTSSLNSYHFLAPAMRRSKRIYESCSKNFLSRTCTMSLVVELDPRNVNGAPNHMVQIKNSDILSRANNKSISHVKAFVIQNKKYGSQKLMHALSIGYIVVQFTINE